MSLEIIQIIVNLLVELVDTPLSSFMDSIANPKMWTTEGEGVGHVLWLTAL
jgi:hypothetical protein